MRVNATLSPRQNRSRQNHLRVRICVIFNPAARGNKARHFRRHLDEMAGQSAFKATSAPGDARRLAAESVNEGFDLIVAAGGDGTVNEVLNGIGGAPNGFQKARLGVLPLGTVNVFARELKIDLPQVEFFERGVRKKIYFAQLAGAGFDARAIELVDFSTKKKIGPLAYFLAGLKALREKKSKITARADGQNFSGELILAGNGKFYGGPFQIFPAADLRDGFLDVCIFERVDFPTLFRCVPNFLVRQKLPEKIVRRFRAEKFELACASTAAFELDGEWIGHLPATFSIAREKLCATAP